MNAINESSVGQEFFDRLNGNGQITLFAPCNSALLRDLNHKENKDDVGKFKDILNMHLVVDDKLYVEKILKNLQTRVSEI